MEVREKTPDSSMRHSTIWIDDDAVISRGRSQLHEPPMSIDECRTVFVH